jgi:hypothetical protein
MRPFVVGTGCAVANPRNPERIWSAAGAEVADVGVSSSWLLP